MADKNIDDLYPLIALFLYECGQNITKEGIKSIFDHLNITCQPKLAELYSYDKNKVESVYSSLMQAPVATSSAIVSEDIKEKKEKEDQKPADEPKQEAEDFDIFGDDDLFG